MLDGLKRGKVVSKAQQRLFFARYPALAHGVAKRGTSFKALPERKGKLPLMGVYCTVSFARAYVEDSGVVLPEADGQVEKLIARAERDIDRLVGPHLRDPLTGLKLVPANLSIHAAGALARATAAQVEWIASVGEETLIGADDGTRSLVAGGMNMDLGPPSRGPSPKVLEELSGHNLVVSRLTAAPDA